MNRLRNKNKPKMKTGYCTLRLGPEQRVQVQSLVRELRFHMLPGTAKKFKKKKKDTRSSPCPAIC